MLLFPAGDPEPHTAAVTGIDEVWRYVQDFDQRRHDSDYPLDGVVVTVDSFAQQEQLGYTSKSPRWRIAYKYAPDQATTKALILSRILDRATSGSIVLMHLGGYSTLDALPELVAALRERGA